MASPRATWLVISEVKAYRDLNSSSRPLVKPGPGCRVQALC